MKVKSEGIDDDRQPINANFLSPFRTQIIKLMKSRKKGMVMAKNKKKNGVKYSNKKLSNMSAINLTTTLILIIIHKKIS